MGDICQTMVRSGYGMGFTVNIMKMANLRPRELI